MIHINHTPDITEAKLSRTNIDLDDELVEEAMKVAGVRTKREAVSRALESFVRPDNRRRASLSRYAGQFELSSLTRLRSSISCATKPADWQSDTISLLTGRRSHFRG
jgi:Arc/MetJ family transcription regulator